MNFFSFKYGATIKIIELVEKPDSSEREGFGAYLEEIFSPLENISNTNDQIDTILKVFYLIFHVFYIYLLQYSNTFKYILHLSQLTRIRATA